MAGVIPTIFRFRAKSNIVKPKRLGISEEGFLQFLWISPVLASNFPGAWYFTWFFGLF
jgi:hypothetical protein